MPVYAAPRQSARYAVSRKQGTSRIPILSLREGNQMKTLIAGMIGFFLILITGSQAFAMTGYLEQDYDVSEDPSIVINRPVNVQGLTGLIMTNSAYTQRKGSMVIGLSAFGENSSNPDFSLLQGIATVTGGVTDRIEVGAKTKVIATNTGSSATRKTGAGDTDILCKFRISSAGENLPAMALGLAYTLPTAETSKGFSEVKREGIRLMVIGTSEREMPGDYVFGVYFEGQIVFIDKLRRPSSSIYADTYGVINAGVLFPFSENRRLQAIVEYNQVIDKNTVTLYDKNIVAVMPGLRYVTPSLNISFGVQFIRRDQTGAENGNRYVGTLSYAF
jgi:hypothetical protein